jgi:hypothetical protein
MSYIVIIFSDNGKDDKFAPGMNMLYQAARQRGHTVADGFSKLLERVQPLDSEVGALKAHRATIEQGLRAEFANFNRLTVIGSHTRDSAIKVVSDVDYLAVVGRSDVTRGGDLVGIRTRIHTLMKNSIAARPCAVS